MLGNQLPSGLSATEAVGMLRAKATLGETLDRTRATRVVSPSFDARHYFFGVFQQVENRDVSSAG
jgi:hypothetical protein